MGYRVTAAERGRVNEIGTELATLRPGYAAIDAMMPQIQALLETDKVLVVSPILRAGGWQLERLQSAGFADPVATHETILRFFRAAPRRYAWYDAANPERSQRNKLVEAHALIGPGELERSLIFERWLYPLRIHQHRQPRALLCEGSKLLAWFGAFHDGVVEPRLRALLSSLIAPMRRRLAIERRLDVAGVAMAALEVTLEQIGSPALLIDAAGVIRDCNEAGRALLGAREDVRGALAAALAGAPGALQFEIVPVSAPGLPSWRLAVLRENRDQRIAAAVRAATRRWRLSARQAAVLERLVHGNANVTIALQLGVSERAVELHVSAIMKRADASNRSAIVAAVLLGDHGE